MSRRSAPRLLCDAIPGHRPYRTRREAEAKASWHPVGACGRCRNGKWWHTWQCGSHWHVGHGDRRNDESVA